MSTTYLLLRNNKETGPFSLEVLLQQDLKPHDLIWVEGQSVGWSNPSEIATLKSYITNQNLSETENATKPVVPQTPVVPGKTERNNHSHIYVSLPSDRSHSTTEETRATNSLEEKAEALYQRVQAFGEGHQAEETDARYGRSLDAMQLEYGTWLLKQRKKKKQGALKKKVLIAASVLVVTTTGFGVTKWISHKSALKQPPLASYALGTITPAEKKQSTTAALTIPADTFTTSTALLQKVIAQNEVETKRNAAKSVAKKNAVPKLKISLPIDTVKEVTLPVLATAPTQKEVKRIIPLSQLVIVSGNLPNDKKESNKTETPVTLQNNSSEILKSVAVTIQYFKREGRPLNKETIYFYNVQPGSAAVLNASGNRRATSAQFQIGTIIRADGSLYLIH